MSPVRCFILLAALLGAFLLTSCGAGKGVTNTAQGTLEGYVFGQAGGSTPPAAGTSGGNDAPAGTVALNGATVRVQSTGQQATTGSDTRGRQGYFKLAGLPAGSYTITVSHDGYQNATFSATVSPGTTSQAGTQVGQTVLTPVASASGRKKWTVLVYMDGDNDLEQYGVLNMNQMESVGTTPDVNLVVQFDRSPGFDQTNGDWMDTRRFLVIRDTDTTNITSPVLQDLGEIDMAKPEAFRDFITWGTTKFPADHYAMVLWNHGAGWRSRSPGASSRGILFDDSSDTYMTMAQLNDGLNVPNVHLDLIAIDASLMGMLEVSYEIRDRTDLIVSSEESPPGEGYPYDKILGPLASDPSMDAETLGRLVVREHIANYPREPVTQALIQTSRLPALARTVDSFAGALLAALPTERAQIDRARASAQAYKYSYYHDLYDFARLVAAGTATPALRDAANAVMQGIPSASGGPVLDEGHSPGEMASSHGLSVYLPQAGSYVSGYSSLGLSSDYPKWSDFTKAFAAPTWQ